MPNIVHNVIELSFEDDKSMQEFSSKVKKEGNNYRLGYSLYPKPKDVVSEYEWSIQTFGGKWADWDTELEILFRDKKLKYSFDSAWAPLVPLAFKINEDYKIHTLLEFVSFENWNEGLIEINKAGEVIRDEYRELDEGSFLNDD